MISRLVFLLFCGNIALNLGNAQKLPRVKRQSLKVQINATGDAVCMRYIRPSPSIKLEGFILGYGSSFFSNQYIPLPPDGKSYITEVDAEPRYLISVRPAPVPNYKKPCSGKRTTPKPLQLVIGTLTPTSVFLSWGILVNPKHDWTTMNNCANDRFYTVRYREKDKNKKWVLQLCPTTETVVDNLKPNTVYEFGVKDNTDNGIWSKIFSHKVAVPSKNKENGQLQNNYKLPKLQTQFIPDDSKVQLPFTIIKQVLQNITQRAQSKISEKPPLSGPILVHLIVPDFNGTPQKLPSLDISQRPKKTLAKNETQEWPAESKTSEVQQISPQSQPAMSELDWERSKPTAPSDSKESEGSPAYSESEQEPSKPSITPLAELPLDTLAHTERKLASSKPSITPLAKLPLGTLVPHKFPEFPKTKMLPTLQMPTETLASSEMQLVPSEPQTPASKTAPTKLAVTNEPTLESFTPKTSKPLDWPSATLAPSEAAFIPFKWKTSATPEGWHVSSAPNLPSLKQNTPKTSRITEHLKATAALPETGSVPSTPKPSAHPKIPESIRAEKEPQWETTTLKIYKTPELPRTTLAPSKTKIPVSKPPILPHLEEPKIVPAVTNKLIPVPTTTKISHTVGHPVATMALTKTDTFSSKPSTAPELSFTTSVLEPITFRNELPIVAPEAKHHVSSSKTTIGPHVIHTKPVPKPIALRTEPPKTETAPIAKDLGSINFHVHVFNGSKVSSKPFSGVTTTATPHVKTGETDPVPFRPKPWFSPDVPPIKPDMEAVTFRTEKPKSTIETRRAPARPKTSPSPGITTTKPSKKGSHRFPLKPKTSPSPKVSQTKPAPPHKVYVSTAKPKKTVLNKTTPAPGRTRTPGGVTWDKISSGKKLTDQDATRLPSTSSSTISKASAHSTVARKKPEPIATPPDSPRPPLAPAKPTPMRRKPLPPNTVTGKPGSSGNVLMPRASSFSIPKPTGPTTHVKTSSLKKPPTAASSPDYSNTTLFSSQPTTETDIAGKPRYTGEHVKYMPKKEDMPCSITDTLQHFPTEEGESTELPISPPQKPPTNLTVVTVEGCPSFVILDWEKPDNETVTEYKVISTENGAPSGKDKSVVTTNQTHSAVENLKPNTSYGFVVIPSNPLGEGPSSESKPFKTESADPRVTEPIPMGKDAIWTEIKFNPDSYSECKGKQYVKRTWYKKFVGVQLCNSLRYKIYLSDSLQGKFYNIGDQRGHGEDHCQFVDSYLDGRTGLHIRSDQLPTKNGFFRAVRQEPVKFGKIGAETRTNYVHWYECGTTIPGKW
ncbi:target of Nesh-SH3 isoform X27 [Rhineura floridana]|uniref:target of Nesh-SH3 isoform X27 n=1 Tax=Rhineura floridana TaxID=261503 RepID=UPI002AC7F59A|nr:target of Nesh-SH3 isoform X27 [Rhineura floridana]